MRVSPDSARSPSNLVVCDAKYASIKPLSCLKCRYQLNVSYPLVGSANSRKKMWKELVDIEAKRLQSAFCVESMGVMQTLDEAQQVGKPVKSGAREVSWIVPMGCDGGNMKEGDVNGKGSLAGVLEARVYVHEKEQLGQAIQMLKADLLGTLRARFKIWEESDMLGSDALDRTATTMLPRRVWFPWKCGISMCDHLTYGESRDAAVQNATELLSSLRIASDDIVDTEMVEAGLSSGDVSVDWDPSSATDSCQTARQPQKGSSVDCSQMSLAVSTGMAVALVGAVIGWFSKD